MSDNDNTAADGWEHLAELVCKLRRMQATAERLSQQDRDAATGLLDKGNDRLAGELVAMAIAREGQAERLRELIAEYAPAPAQLEPTPNTPVGGAHP